MIVFFQCKFEVLILTGMDMGYDLSLLLSTTQTIRKDDRVLRPSGIHKVV